tara:strand:+ start:13081 stop:13599 length:519 start_codon:yes stop_codon:yes gene_type:complete
MSTPPVLPSLTADCASCAGLCCVMLAFDKGEDFALDKPAHQPCPNLSADFSCAIHDRLDQAGFPGCRRYDCLGAGQRVTQEVFKGKDWRSHPETLPAMADAFAILRRVHRDLELLAAARALPLTAARSAELSRLLSEANPADGWSEPALARFAQGDHGARVARFLRGLRDHV